MSDTWVKHTAENVREMYKRVTVVPKPDGDGSAMWSMALDRVMLTYFVVQPERRWDTHSHESEQITLVLEGELFFEIGPDVVSVGAGQAIGIPAHVPHAVSSGKSGATAADAWSPPMREYLQAVDREINDVSRTGDRRD